MSQGDVKSKQLKPQFTEAKESGILVLGAIAEGEQHWC